MGCSYIQVDAPDFGQLVDESQQRAWEAAGISFERVLTDGADMLNELASISRRDVRAAHVQGQLRQPLDQRRRLRLRGRAPVPAPALLRSDPARVRGRALGFVRTAQPSRPDASIREISWRSRLSAASPRRAITEQAQEQKLQLIAEVARRAWG
jgi:hypothetical protein